MVKKRRQLDKFDRQLLYWMDLNCRASLSSLAKKMHTSSAKLGYRLAQLEKNRIIHSFITLIDYRKLGYRGYAVYFRLKEINEKEKKEIMEKVMNVPRVVDVLLTQGRYDLHITFLVENTDDASESLWHIRELLEKYTLDEKRCVHLRTEFFTREKFLDKGIEESTKEPRLIMHGHEKKLEIDDVDKRILIVMADNANWPMWKIAKEAKLGGPTTYNRIKKLEKRGVITGYTIKTNPNLEGFLFYRVLVNLHYIPEKRKKEFIGYLNHHPAIYRSSFLFGEYDLTYDARLANDSELRQLLGEVYSHFSNEVIRQDWVRVHDILKFSFFVKE
ncbi:MAG: winged helix-turn-helix transcriptional regulator [Candidatus Micrarchaeota archaeon]